MAGEIQHLHPCGARAVSHRGTPVGARRSRDPADTRPRIDHLAWRPMRARALPLTSAVSLMRGVWGGDGWLAHSTDIVALIIVMVVGVTISAKWFRWE